MGEASSFVNPLTWTVFFLALFITQHTMILVIIAAPTPDNTPLTTVDAVTIMDNEKMHRQVDLSYNWKYSPITIQPWSICLLCPFSGVCEQHCEYCWADGPLVV